MAKNILGEFLFGALIPVPENHDLAPVLLGQPLDEVKTRIYASRSRWATTCAA